MAGQPHSADMGPAVIADVGQVDAVLTVQAKATQLLARQRVHDGEVVKQVDGAVVEAHVIVGTQTQHVLRDVRAKVGSPESPDVSAFRVWPSRYRKQLTTDLAAYLYQRLTCSITALLRTCRCTVVVTRATGPPVSCSPSTAVGSRRTRRNCQIRKPSCPGLFQWSSTLNSPVIAEPRWGRVARIATRPTDDADWQAVELATDQASVAGGRKVLIGNLPLGGGIVAAMPGVDDDIAVVRIVQVPAGDHDRVGAFPPVARDPAHRWPVNARGDHLAAGPKRGTDRTPGHLSEELSHGPFPVQPSTTTIMAELADK
jgi:hypothetical protein